MTQTKIGPDTAAAGALDGFGRKDGDIVTCDACPVLCRIRLGKTGACDRYGNVEGKLARLDPVVVTRRVIDEKGAVVPFLSQGWDGSLVSGANTFVTGIGVAVARPLLGWRYGIMAGFDAGALLFFLVCIPLLSHHAAKMRISACQNDANRPVLLLITGAVMLVTRPRRS